MAIESAVKSIAVVPDRFFDIKGRAYSIDWNRKISADSLPTYENYKSAVIYRINTTSNFVVPPIAEIIFDNEMQNRCGVEQVVKFNAAALLQQDGTYNLFRLLEKTGTFYEKGVVGGTVTDGVLTMSTVTGNPTTDANKIHFVLCPKDRTIKVQNGQIVERPKYDEATGLDISIRVFTLNTYGITKYLNDDVGNLASDIENTLVKYLQNHATTNMFDFAGRPVGEEDDTQTSNDDGSLEYIEDSYNSISTITAELDLSKGDYLAIIVDANNNYWALVGQVKVGETSEDAFAQSAVKWYKPSVDVNVTQFQGIDMWLRFESVNEMIYFLITKYEQDIQEIRSALICPKDETPNGNWDVNRNRTALHQSTAKEDKKEEGALWAYVNPRTMQPYSDDYWFHQGDPYYVKSLTLAQDGKRIKGNQITVKADEWPGMYMVVGETRIRNRDTGEDERVQLKFPQCKVKADQTLTLSADGDPTTFTINLEVAKPRNGHMMEITAYEIATKMTEGENGCYYAIDGSSKVVTE